MITAGELAEKIREVYSGIYGANYNILLRANILTNVILLILMVILVYWNFVDRRKIKKE